MLIQSLSRINNLFLILETLYCGMFKISDISFCLYSLHPIPNVIFIIEYSKSDKFSFNILFKSMTDSLMIILSKIFILLSCIVSSIVISSYIVSSKDISVF